MMPVFMAGSVAALEAEEKALQDTMLKLRYAQGAHGRGAAGPRARRRLWLALTCARRVAHVESYLGLVEVGVGLIPGAGGLLYGARRSRRAGACANAPLLRF